MNIEHCLIPVDEELHIQGFTKEELQGLSELYVDPEVPFNLEEGQIIKVGHINYPIGKDETLTFLDSKTFIPLKYRLIEGKMKRKAVIVRKKNGQLQWQLGPTVVDADARGEVLYNVEEEADRRAAS